MPRRQPPLFDPTVRAWINQRGVPILSLEFLTTAIQEVVNVDGGGGLCGPPRIPADSVIRRALQDLQRAREVDLGPKARHLLNWAQVKLRHALVRSTQDMQNISTTVWMNVDCIAFFFM